MVIGSLFLWGGRTDLATVLSYSQSVSCRAHARQTLLTPASLHRVGYSSETTRDKGQYPGPCRRHLTGLYKQWRAEGVEYSLNDGTATALRAGSRALA